MNLKKFPRRLLSILTLAVATLICCWLWKLVDGARQSPAGPAQHQTVGESRGSNDSPTLDPLPSAVNLPDDFPESPHPVERAMAGAEVLDARIKPGPRPGYWLRSRIARTSVQPDVVRTEEEWLKDENTGRWTCARRDMYLASQIILKVRPGIARSTLDEHLQTIGMTVVQAIGEDLFTVRLPSADLDAFQLALQSIASLPNVAQAVEPDGVGFGGAIPNDTSFSIQWGLHNTGQNGGSVDADVDAPEFWDIMESAPGIIIAVLDSGLNFTHPDLQNVAWTNPNEIPGNGIDDDSSGRVDDINGWDFVNNDNNPTDDHGHGSNVTGIITANRNNNAGIAGMIGGVPIIVCKILNSSNSGTTSNLIAATTYARLRGVPIMNLSLQNYPFSSTLNTEFTACQTAGIVLSICAGNQGVNNDVTPNYPSSYNQSNIIAVGNHDRTDVRWSGAFNPSNYGAASVDLFAPGREILSPILGTAYSSYTGTSQATPYVTAMCAAIKYVKPAWTATEITSCILDSAVRVASYNGICTTGARLNTVDAIARAFRQAPAADADGDRFSDLFEYLAGTRIDSSASRPAHFSDYVGGYLRVGVPRVQRGDAQLVVETSPDLITWGTAGVTDFSSSNQLLGGILTSGAPRGFLRIRAIPLP